MSSFTVPYGVTSTALFIRVKAEANGEYYEGWGLIDTGSVDSGITETVVNKLNVVPIKGKEYHTANGKIVAPRYHKFKEAKDLIAIGGGFSITDDSSFRTKMDELLTDPTALETSGQAAGDFVKNSVGATDQILRQIHIR